uniref:Uncharacterized protein n=1 Tax=Arundo donax TaxID=35708 RepID=A0A0A9BT59_ARUDO
MGGYTREFQLDVVTECGKLCICLSGPSPENEPKRRRRHGTVLSPDALSSITVG